MTGDEEEREFGRMVGLNVALLKLCGVIPLGKGTGFMSNNVLACIAFACLSLYTVSYTYEFATNGDDPETLLELFAMIISIVGGQARFGILLWFRGSCRKMLDAYETFWLGLKLREREIVRSYSDKSRVLTRWYMIICVFTIFFYVFFALFGRFIFDEPPSGNVNETSRYQRQLPYAFFLDVEETPWYEIMCAVQVLTIFNVGMVCVGVDMFGPLVILVACGYLDTVRSRIENLHEIEGSSSRESGSRVKKDLRACLIRHGTLLDLCEDIERITNVMFFTQLFGSTYNISLVGFKLVEDNPDKFKYVTQLAISVIQLFLCNWPPDVLLAKSEAIGRAAYSTPWYRYPGQLLRPTCILMIRGQRPVRLTAGKFVGLSLETFASMISTAASFFTMVRNID
ncbi:odorant receptor 49b-like isoform X2 [Ceratina calcarata]|uniref:Odorant receptor n=1 Tax=Ceratina calcarata TaxID=156304 RepID=A0AAJ7JB93_9HYME|nr:odorant receptor 49b-like isoform X2 [Ceratina calcarata]